MYHYTYKISINTLINQFNMKKGPRNFNNRLLKNYKIKKEISINAR